MSCIEQQQQQYLDADIHRFFSREMQMPPSAAGDHGREPENTQTFSRRLESFALIGPVPAETSRSGENNPEVEFASSPINGCLAAVFSLQHTSTFVRRGMTTSITDARYTSLHFTPGASLALSIDEPPETGWSVMPGYDEQIPIPPEQEPPRMDADETLPNLLHPSYPYGRPPTLNGKGGQGAKGWTRGGKSLLSTVGDGIDLRGGNGGAAGRGWMGSRWAGEEGWAELALGGFGEKTAKKEVPPGMAGAKRPPSPPSPALRPSQAPQPRSEHLRNLYARQQQANPQPTADQFDAPVPNELYAEEGDAAGNESALTNTVVPEAMDDQQRSFRSDENNHDDDDDRSVD